MRVAIAGLRNCGALRVTRVTLMTAPSSDCHAQTRTNRLIFLSEPADHRPTRSAAAHRRKINRQPTETRWLRARVGTRSACKPSPVPPRSSPARGESVVPAVELLLVG